MVASRLAMVSGALGTLVCAGALRGADALGDGVVVDIGAVTQGSWGDYPRHVGHPRWSRSFGLGSGAESYGLQYSCCTHPSHAPEVATPEGYIGMPRPISANWYHNGFVRFIVNGRDIGRTPLTALRRGATGRQGSVELVWDRADVVVRATFLMCAQDPTLYLELRASPRKPLKPIVVELTAYPLAYAHDADRWVVTPKRGIRQPKTEALEPVGESWLLVQDHKLSGPGRGGCGMAFLPAEIAAGKAKVGTYAVRIELESKPGVRRVHLAIWDFHARSDADARAYVESSIVAVQKRLATLDFGNPRLKPAYWAQRRPELAGLLDRVKGQSKLATKVKTCVGAIDALYARIAQCRSKDQPVPVAVEESLLTELGKIDTAYWDLRLAALFAED